jgi:cyclophilin family peptidyl-prolyl cis-trans isomerase
MKQTLLLTIITFCSFINQAIGEDVIVTIETNLGNITLELYPDITPVTVANFLDYTNNQFYDGLIFHRVIYGFMNQAGIIDPNGIGRTTNPPIVNEFNISNTRGTIAMAKLGGDPDSATSQFFINANDNSANLDNQNGGFTVFGRVIIGMDVVDIINRVLTSSDKPVDPVIMTSVYVGAPTEAQYLDDDNDGVANGKDLAPLDNFICSNIDIDGCDDCSSGIYDIRNDGVDTDGNGICDSGLPANSICTQAITLLDDTTVFGHTFVATGIVWYEYTPPNEDVTISLCGSNYDTRLVIIEECSSQSATAYNDDACGLQSEITVTLIPGEPYFIGVYGYNNAAGYYKLNASAATACLTPPTADLTNDCLVNTDDLAIISLYWLQVTNIGDLSGDAKVNLIDVAMLISGWQDCGYFNPNACPQ